MPDPQMVPNLLHILKKTPTTDKHAAGITKPGSTADEVKRMGCYRPSLTHFPIIGANSFSPGRNTRKKRSQRRRRKLVTHTIGPQGTRKWRSGLLLKTESAPNKIPGKPGDIAGAVLMDVNRFLLVIQVAPQDRPMPNRSRRMIRRSL